MDSIERGAFNDVLPLALIRADRVLGLRAEDVSCVSANDTPAIVACRKVDLVDDVDRGDSELLALHH